MVKPITPQEASKVIPDFVIQVVNDLINENLHPISFKIYKKDVVARIKNVIEGDFDYRWLDFESVYEQYGWKVNYDGPGYNESYEAFYHFKPK